MVEPFFFFFFGIICISVMIYRNDHFKEQSTNFENKYR